MKKIIGGIITLIIGGGAFAISQSSIVDNFSKNTGLTQDQAQQYINNIPQSDLKSFTEIGNSLVSDSNSVQNIAFGIDCANYTYKWESSILGCSEGKNQLQKTGIDEATLGKCYQALGTDLGSSARSKISECIQDIDTLTSDDNLPIVTSLLDSKTISDERNTNAYNKSILQAALESK